MRQNQDTLFSWHDLRLALEKQRWKAGGVFLAILLIFVTWAVLAPRQYESTSQLYVRLGRGTATLDATASSNANAAIYQTREDEINTARQIADSRSIAEKVVDQIGVEVILNPRAASDAAHGNDAVPKSSWRPSLSWLIPQLDPETARSRAVRKVHRQMRIWSPAHSSIITLQCTAATPAMAQRIVRTWTDTFLSEYVRLTHAARSYEFFTKQTDTAHKQLGEVERRLVDMKSEAGLVSVAGQVRVLEQEFTTIRSLAEASEAALAAARARVEDISRKLADMPSRIVLQDSSGVPSHAWDLMRARLYELQTREAQLQVKYTESYEPLVEMRQQRKELEAILDNQAESRRMTMLGPNPTYQALEQELLKEQAAIAARIAEGKSLHNQQTALKNEMKAFNEQGRQIGEMERKATVLQTTYVAHAGKMEEARIDEAIEQDRITSVNVTQPATFIEKPVSPAKTRCLILGLLLGAAGAAGAAMAAQRIEERRRAPAAIENPVTIPSLASLPKEPSHPTIASRS
jgi:uncharacterized protein involved in exopolysaccharide biosynthesis